MGTAGAEALWPKQLAVSRQQEVEGCRSRRGKEDPQAGGWWWARPPGSGLRLYPRCDRELLKGFEQ